MSYINKVNSVIPDAKEIKNKGTTSNIGSTVISVGNILDVNDTIQQAEIMLRYGCVIDDIFALLGDDIYAVITDTKMFLRPYVGKNAIHLPISPGDKIPEGSVTGQALKTGNYVRSYKSSAESKFGGIPYTGRSNVIYEQDNPLGIFSIVMSTDFEEKFMAQCDIMLEHIAGMDTVMGRISNNSDRLYEFSNEIISIGNTIKTQILPMILDNVAKLENTVRKCNTLSYNSQIIALRANSDTFKVIAKEISQHAKLIGALLVRIKSLAKKIDVVLGMIERLMIRIDQFAKKSVSEGKEIFCTTAELLASLQGFRKELENGAFNSLTENLSVQEIHDEQKKRTVQPQNNARLHIKIQRLLELLPTIALLTDSHVLIGVPIDHENGGMYVAGSHGRNSIEGFNIVYNEPVLPKTILYKTITEKKNQKTIVEKENSAYNVPYISRSVRVFDDNGGLLCVLTIVMPWECISNVKNSITTTEEKIARLQGFIGDSVVEGEDMKHIVNELRILIKYLGLFSERSEGLWKYIQDNEPSLQQLRLACNIEGARNKGTKSDVNDNTDFSTAGGDLGTILSKFSSDANNAIASMKQLTKIVNGMKRTIDNVETEQDGISTELTGIDSMTRAFTTMIYDADKIVDERIKMIK